MPSLRRAVVAALLGLASVAGPHADAAGTPSPDRDQFYRYTGAKPLAQIAPGTILKQRGLRTSFGTQRTPVPAVQLLYRTTDQLGAPSVTVTTVLLPEHRRIAPRVVGYLSFYDGLGAKCDPSYTLNGGKADSATEQQSMEEDLLINWYLSQDFILTVPDFEGTGLHGMAARESGFGSLDAIHATESYLRVGASTPVGLSGYSGGALAADWAAELAPSYAPELNIVGVAAGGVPVHFFHNLTYINGSQDWSGIIPAVLTALSRAYGLDLSAYLNDYGKSLVAKDSTGCIGDFNGTHPGLTIQKMLKPQYADVRSIKVFVDVINKLIMGT